MQAIKIIIGALLLLGAVRNVSDVFVVNRNANEAAGYMIPTLFFFILGVWLLYSGIRTKSEPSKIYDDSDDDTP